MSEVHYAQIAYPISPLGDGGCPDGRTLKVAGCKVTTEAEILTLAGHATAPPTYNAQALAKHAFYGHCLLGSDSLAKVHPELFRLESFTAFSGPANLALVDNTPSDVFVELRIAWPHGRVGDHVHFLMVYRYKKGQPSSEVIVLDSYDGKVKRLSAYGDDPKTLITGIARYRLLKAPAPATAPQPPVVVAVPSLPPVTAPDLPTGPTGPSDESYDVVVPGVQYLIRSTPDLASAKNAAQSYALAHRGSLVLITDSHGATIDSRFVAGMPNVPQGEAKSWLERLIRLVFGAG